MPIVSGFFRVFFAISILTLPGLSFLSAGPAADTLKAEAEPFEFVIPEPSLSLRERLAPLHDQDRDCAASLRAAIPG